MLHGYLQYKDDHFGVVQYEVYAKDNFDGMKLYLNNGDLSNYTNYTNAAMVYDKVVVPLVKEDGVTPISGQEQEELTVLLEKVANRLTTPDQKALIYNPYEAVNPSDARRLDIKQANKFKTNITNMDFCVRVAAIIRYMQINGKTNYNQNVLTEEDHFKTQRVVQVGELGYLKYDMGLIKELRIVSPFVALELKEIPDDVFDVGIFKELKEKDKYGHLLSVTPIVNPGFKLTEATLGFEYVPPIKNEPVNIFGMYETIEEVIENNPDKNTAWILDRKYEIVTDDNLEQVMAEFYAHDGYIAFDTETQGLKINFKSRTGEADQLVGCVLSKEIGTGYYFPLQHKLFPNLCNGDHFYFMERYMKRLLEGKKIIGHNIKYDWKVAYIYDINTNFVYDTLLAFGVTKRYEEESYSLSLKNLVRSILGLDMFELSDFVTTAKFSDSGITFADLPYEIVRRYAPADADMTLSMFEFLEREQILARYEAHDVFEMEVNFAKAVSYAEFFGYHVNVPQIPSMRENIEGNMEKYRNQMFKMAGKEFNPNSPPQLKKIMYTELGIEQIDEKGSTNKEILKTLADRTDANGDPLYPFVVALKKYRDNEGIFKNFLKKLHEFATPDGFIFSDTQQLGTDTGRTSAKDPNYQSYNDAVKKNIIPRAGFTHFDSDFSQIEYRVLASMAQQLNLMEEFDDADLDYHTYQAARMFNIPYSLVSKALRSQSKGINFGLPYGMGDSSLGARIFGERTKETQAKAAQLRRKFFQGQERIEEFFERVRSEGVAKGYTKTHWGRRRYYHRGTYSVNEIRRQAGNHVIQGTAADIYKLACCRLFNRIVDEGWLGKVLINVFVHDELLIEVHESINHYYFFKAWREEFQLVIDGFCKLYAGAGVGRSWYEAKKQDLPPQYIDEIINQWHEDMPWDNDTDKFLADIKQGYEDYKIRRIAEFIQDPTHQGDIIKPVIYSLLVETVEKLVAEIRSADNSAELLNQYNGLFGKELIPREGKTSIKLLQEYLAVFCHNYGIDLSKLDIRSPEESSSASSSTPSNSTDLVEDEEIAFEDDSFSVKDMVDLRGYYRDEVNNIVYIKDKPMIYSGVNTTVVNYLFSKSMFKAEGTYQMALFQDGVEEPSFVNAFIMESDYQALMATYNSLNQTNLQYGRTGWGF